MRKIDVLQPHLPGSLRRADDGARVHDEGHRQADARRPDAGRSRRAVRVMDALRGTSRCCRCRRRRSKCSPSVSDAVDLAQRANDGMAELVSKYPDRFPAFVASLPMNDPDAAVRELASRDRRSRRARHPDLLQHPRQADLDAPRVPADLRGDGRARPADLAASVPRRRHAPTTDGGAIAVRDLVDVRLALRDQRRDGAPGVRRVSSIGFRT